MRRTGPALAAALLLAPSLGGCVAMAFPAVASGAAVRDQLKIRAARRARAASAAPQGVAAGGYRVLPGVTALPAPDGSVATPAAPLASNATVPDTMRWLYGSGEAAASSVQLYQALAAYVTGPVAYTRAGKQRQTVLAEGAPLDKPYFEPCGEKKRAVVLDVDETALLNLGYEADAARSGAGFDVGKWSRWEATGADKVTAVPGAKTALDTIRKAGIVVIFNTNRSAANADATARAIEGAGLGPAKHAETLFLKGDDGGTGSGKDVRRWAIASGYCVVATVGDQLGDFSDLFNDPALSPARRRAIAAAAPFAALWGAGWFLLPNPVYGPGVAGTFDDIFPQDMRWRDTAPAEGAKP